MLEGRFIFEFIITKHFFCWLGLDHNLDNLHRKNCKDCLFGKDDHFYKARESLLSVFHLLIRYIIIPIVCLAFYIEHETTSAATSFAYRSKLDL